VVCRASGFVSGNRRLAGRFVHVPRRSGYSVDQALDLLNSYLLTKGYTLVRRERLLLVIDLESPIPEELVTLVTIDELDERGRYELVKCVFPLARMTADEARRMIEAYLGPQGLVIGFPAARQILVTETAGKLRVIRDMIARVEDPKLGGLERIVDFQLAHVTAEEVLAIARPLLGLTADQNYNAEISISATRWGRGCLRQAIRTRCSCWPT
jgi:type II secretory pathway component GspD/PulD (secretin)